jgi:hypothetical protein
MGRQRGEYGINMQKKKTKKKGRLNASQKIARTKAATRHSGILRGRTSNWSLRVDIRAGLETRCIMDEVRSLGTSPPNGKKGKKGKKAKPSWIQEEMASARLLIQSRAGNSILDTHNQAIVSSPIKSRRPPSAKKKAHRKQLEDLLSSQSMWPKASKHSMRMKKKTATNPLRPVSAGRRVVHVSEAKERCSSLSPFAGKAVFGSSERRGLELEMMIRDAATKPDPGVHQPKEGFSTMCSNGGKFNMSKAKTHIEWEMYRAKQLPAPGEYDTAKLGSNLKGGGFNLSNAKSDVEWEIYRASQIPDPGQHEPDGGFSAFKETSGGAFNMSKPKSHVDWEIYRAQQVPSPGEHQPMGGYDPTAHLSKHSGKISKYYAKSDVEFNILRSAQLPDPGSNQPAYGFSTLDKRGQGMSLAKPKSEVEWAIYRASFLPEPGSYDIDGDFNKKTHNVVFQKQQENAVIERRVKAKTRLKSAIKRIIAQRNMEGGGKSFAALVVASAKTEGVEHMIGAAKTLLVGGQMAPSNPQGVQAAAVAAFGMVG